MTTNSDSSWNNALDGDTSTQSRKMGNKMLTFDTPINNVIKLQLKVARDGDVDKVNFTVTDSAASADTSEKTNLPFKAEADAI